MFDAVGDGLTLSSCKTVVAKFLDLCSLPTMFGKEAASSSSLLHAATRCGAAVTEEVSPAGVLESSRTNTTIKTTHAFSARVAHSADADGIEDEGKWSVDVHVTCYAPEAPSVLVGFGPWRAPLSFNNAVTSSDDETAAQSAYEGRILSTPMLWEEPGFVFLECDDRPPRLWSETKSLYSAAPTLSSSSSSTSSSTPDSTWASCFRRVSDVPADNAWRAAVRVSWMEGKVNKMTSCDDNNKVPDTSCSGDVISGEYEFGLLLGDSPGSAATEGMVDTTRKMWKRVASGTICVSEAHDAELYHQMRRGGVRPYVTFLSHVPSVAHVTSTATTADISV